MRFSVITPCFDASRYLEETILAVVNQSAVISGRVTLDYWVIDGGSCDDTAQIVARYADRGVRFLSEPDNGMYDALVKGFKRISGDVVCYINAGDYHHPAAFDVVCDLMASPEIHWLTGMYVIYNERSHVVLVQQPVRRPSLWIRKGYYGRLLAHIQQESTFWRRDLLDLVDMDALSQYRLAGALIQANQVDRSASFGIRFANRTGVQVIENSVFKACQRFTDCAGIYTFTGGAVASQPTQFVQAGVVRGNIVVDARSNTEGCASPCDNLAAGIFLDEMTSGAVVINNTVSNTEAGIQLHNASFNRITSNRVFGSSSTAFRGSLTQNIRGIFRGNVIAGNLLFSHRSSVLQAGGLPAISDNSTAMHWHHTITPVMLFTGPAPNIVAGNRYLSALPTGRTSWRMSSNKTQNLLSDQAWKGYAPTDFLVNPLTYSPHKLETSASLVANGNFDPLHANSWSSYLNPNGTGSSISLGNQSKCAGGCALLQTGTTSDYLSSAPFSLDSTTGRNLYLLKFQAAGGINGGLRKAMIRRNTSPWENFGLNLPAISLAPGQTYKTEEFFRATISSNEAVVDIRSAPNLETRVSDLSLVRVTKFEQLQLGRLMTQAVNLDKATRAFNCNDLAIGTCNLVDESGRPVSFPLQIPARSAFPLFVAEPMLVYAPASI